MYRVYIIFAVTALSNNAKAVLETKTNSQGHEPHEIRLVAQADGKSFFAENTPIRNWTEADDFCRRTGMKLASIATEAQYLALKEAYSVEYFNFDYWTAGRDANDFSQFTWNNEPERPASAGFLDMQRLGTLPEVCLTFAMKPNHIGQVWANPCAAKFGTLCEF